MPMRATCFHFRVKEVKRGKGRKRVLYVMRLEARFQAREDLVSSGAGNLPYWCGKDPVEFFAQADAHERVRGTVAKEITAALPRSLPREAMDELIRLLISKVTQVSGVDGTGVHAYCFGFHLVRSSDGGSNPHVHLVWCERIDDGYRRDARAYFSRAAARTYKSRPRPGYDPASGGCRKSRRLAPFARAKNGSLASSPELLHLRHWWAEECNRLLAKHGCNERFSERSYRSRNLAKRPGVHRYDSSSQIERRGGHSVRAARDRAAKLENAARDLYDALQDHAARLPSKPRSKRGLR